MLYLKKAYQIKDNPRRSALVVDGTAIVGEPVRLQFCQEWMNVESRFIRLLEGQPQFWEALTPGSRVIRGEEEQVRRLTLRGGRVAELHARNPLPEALQATWSQDRSSRRRRPEGLVTA